MINLIHLNFVRKFGVVIYLMTLPWLFLGEVHAGTQGPLILNDLIEEAKKNNPEILSAKKRWDASLTRVPQARSLDNPQVGITFEKIPSGTLKLNETMPDDRMLSISQMFPELALTFAVKVGESP